MRIAPRAPEAALLSGRATKPMSEKARQATPQPAKVTPFAGGNEAESEKRPQASFSHQQEVWRGRRFCAT